MRQKFIDDDGTLITYEENYPFFQYFGYSVTVYYKDEVICKLYHYNNRCTPYHIVQSYYFGNKSKEMIGKSSDTIQIGSIPMLILYNLITILKARVDNDHHTKNIYYKLNSHILEMQNWYLDKESKTIFDDTIFKYFIIECKGDMLTPQMEKQLRIERKRKSGKAYTYRYNPETDGNKTGVSTYRFKNSSGNPIRNEKNLQIDLIADEMDIRDDLESELDYDSEPDEASE